MQGEIYKIVASRMRAYNAQGSAVSVLTWTAQLSTKSNGHSYQ